MYACVCMCVCACMDSPTLQSLNKDGEKLVAVEGG